MTAPVQQISEIVREAISSIAGRAALSGTPPPVSAEHSCTAGTSLSLRDDLRAAGLLPPIADDIATRIELFKRRELDLGIGGYTALWLMTRAGVRIGDACAIAKRHGVYPKALVERGVQW